MSEVKGTENKVVETIDLTCEECIEDEDPPMSLDSPAEVTMISEADSPSSPGSVEDSIFVDKNNEKIYTHFNYSPEDEYLKMIQGDECEATSSDTDVQELQSPKINESENTDFQ